MTESKREGSRILLTALRDLMTSSGLPVAEIAKKTGLTRQHLHMLKRGEGSPSLDSIEKIFAACDDDFGEWFKENAADRYGRDKALHDQIQALLNQKGDIARLVRGSLRAYLTLWAKEQSEKRETPRETNTEQKGE